VPEEILTDNGKVFTGRFGRNDTEVLFDKICRENGINHLLTKPRSPTTTGKIERWHYTLRREFVSERTFTSLQDLQAQLDAWVKEYNTERPHQELGMATPLERFSRRTTTTNLPLDASVAIEHSGDDWVTRTVAANGVIAVSGQVLSAGKHRAGHVVEVKVTESTLEVWDGNEFLKAVLRTTKGGVRKKRAQRPPKKQ
jgi:hypothetical protein